MAPKTPQQHWDLGVTSAARVFEVHDLVPWDRDRRLAAFSTWRIAIPTAENLSTTLLALRLHAAAASGPLDAIPLAQATSTDRPHYELFAGLDAVSADPGTAHALRILKLLSYEEPRGALTLMRLDAGAQTSVGRLARRYRKADLALRDLPE
ncbi:hypothetical protein [Actinacidiphila epipremni]|uniref:Uncharacterized protein n=1 Tax=Actinacidiphila epipremni TaxID=2053013 RepID=A0ABX0ZP95_9ACTN|nr:hypothetical protein [Actinacidiphila epipremni]NJP43468.1 hypothetical protein [Actinacidiphila epipremni]